MATQPSGLPGIGEAYEGGLVGGYISYNADGVATHGLICGPESSTASGTGYTVTTNLQWHTTSFTVTTSNPDGKTNTDNIIAAASAGQAPAAQFCAGLSVGGYSDWYLPTVIEQEIIYFHCKPTTNNNSTNRGINSYAIPPRTVNFTTTDPAQTTISAFQSGGTHAWQASGHVNSVKITNTATTRFDWNSAFTFNVEPTNAGPVHAIRRFAV
jgi:hypothetical protein